jgi:hypothetical protein
MLRSTIISHQKLKLIYVSLPTKFYVKKIAGDSSSPNNLLSSFVVDVHTTCFGLHGHLQVCKIFYFLVLKESA